MKNRVYWAIGIVIVVVIAIFFLTRNSEESDYNIYVKAKQGDFTIDVTTTGELEAKSSVNIMGPSRLRNARIYEVEIEKLIPEGTVVEKGDFVASLDKSQLMERMADEETELEQERSALVQTEMDTALELRAARDELINLQFAVDEAKLTLEQSQFEPPATIQKNEMEYEKAKRNLKQAKENYVLKRNKAKAQMREQLAKVAERQQRYDFLDRLSDDFVILAPENGMVIYFRRWGEVIQEGSSMGVWNPIVATLPDLSRMISKTYINEVDIRKITQGQTVEIGLDAFPDKSLTGEVIYVANVGQTKPNSDSKVFEVKIEINEHDTTLRPSMTTSNRILVEKFNDVVYVPLEAVHSQGDTLNYIIKKAGIGYSKKEVIVGAYNENEIIISEGLKPEEEILLTVPDGVDDLIVDRLTLETRKIASK